MPFRAEGWGDNTRHLAKIIKETNVATIIEVGTWMDRTTLKLAKMLTKNGKIYAVDSFAGEPSGFYKYDPKIVPTLWDQFLSNVIHDNLTHKIVPVRMTSEEAAKKLNQYVHLIYIDATHNY